MSDSEGRDDFAGHRTLDATVTSNAADGATIDINGTELLIMQHNRHVPVLAEIWVENESKPIGAINTARGDTVCLGGVEEGLADRVDEISEMPVAEIPAALERLAYRLNPSGREPPEELQEDPDTDSKASDSSTEQDADKQAEGSERRGWFDALGEDVPAEQRQAARDEAEKMGVNVDEDEWVDEVACLVEADRPDDAIETARKRLDMTGVYRFLAALCVPVEEQTT